MTESEMVERIVKDAREALESPGYLLDGECVKKARGLLKEVIPHLEPRRCAALVMMADALLANIAPDKKPVP